MYMNLVLLLLRERSKFWLSACRHLRVAVVLLMIESILLG